MVSLKFQRLQDMLRGKEDADTDLSVVDLKQSVAEPTDTSQNEPLAPHVSILDDVRVTSALMPFLVVQDLMPLIQVDRQVYKVSSQGQVSQQVSLHRTAMSDMRASLKHSDSTVRKSALDGLTRETTWGDRTVIAEVVACLSDTNAEVRATASRALSRLADKGDRHVLMKVANHLETCGSKDNRLAALQAFSKLMQPSNGHIPQKACPA